MKINKIVLLYNLQRLVPDFSKPESFIEVDFDTKGTIQALYDALTPLSKKVDMVEANINSIKYFLANKNKIDLVFNYSVGFHGADHYAHFPALFEMLSIPYIGQSPLAQGLISNKIRMKKTLSSFGIKTAQYFTYKELSSRIKRKAIKFPVIIKPAENGSSAGMTQDAVIYNLQELKAKTSQFKKVFDNFFIESFLEGKEFSVSLIGNPPIILPIVELNYDVFPKNLKRFSSYEIKSQQIEVGRSFIECPAKINLKTRLAIEKIALKVWNELELRDWLRIDFRMDNYNRLYVLDINCPASLEPLNKEKGYCSMTTAAYKNGWKYNQLIANIAKAAIKRYY